MGPKESGTAQAAVYIDGQPVFYSAFLQKNELFPPPELAAEPTEAEKEEWEDVERAWKIQSMMGGLDRHTRHKALEAAE